MTAKQKRDIAHVERQIATCDLAPVLSVRVGDAGRVDLVRGGVTVASRPIESVQDLGVYVIGFSDGCGYVRSSEGETYFSDDDEED